MLQISAGSSSRKGCIDSCDAKGSRLKTRSVVIIVFSVFQFVESDVLGRIQPKACEYTGAIFTLDIACQNVLATSPR